MRWHLRRLHYLLKRVTGSISQRGMAGTASRIMQELRPLRTADTGWQLEPLEPALPPPRIPYAEVPRVSVIIPVHGKLPYTLACLRTIARYGAAAAFEVIVVDDASPDRGADVLADISGLRLLRNTRNLGFIGSCNAAAEIARGAFLLFLNNDTQVTPGWLDQLLACFDDEPDCGIAGSRLAYPDGRLQEAGGLVYAHGEAWNYGRFERRDDPRFLYRRDVDYVSGAALMVETALFKAVGGFDARYAPAYCEDMDLAFAVRAAGRRVIYQPASLVIHCEGISSGLDPFAGTKQHQVTNQAVFERKWRATLARHPRRGTPAEQAIHHRGERHILIVDALAPDPSRDSGSLRLVNIMRLMREQGWRITFMADNRRASGHEIELLGRLGVHVLCKPWAPSLATWLRRNGGGLNAVMLCRHYVAQPHLPLVRRLAPRATVAFDTVDLHFLREQRAAEHTGNGALLRQAEVSRRQELSLMRSCDATFVVSPVEHAMLAELVPGIQVELLSNVHEIFGRNRGFPERSGLVFVGGYAHPPNVDAVQWLVEDILPLIHAHNPDMVLHLIGDMPDAVRRALARPGVQTHGRVEDLTPWMETCRVALAPLRYGAGVKGKVNMAMSHGLPVVATPAAAEGMQLIDGESVLLAGDAASFASAVLRLHEDEALWLRLSDGGLDNVSRHFSFSAARESLQRTFG